MRCGPRCFSLAAILMISCGGSAPAQAPATSKTSLLGKPAPSFKRDALDGPPVVLAAPGRVVVVKFVAKYCEPCVRTLPAIQRLHERHPEISIVAIAEDELERDARDLVTTHHLTFPVIHDVQQVLAARYRVSDLPSTFIINGSGTIVWFGGPDKSETDLTTAIEATHP